MVQITKKTVYKQMKECEEIKFFDCAKSSLRVFINLFIQTHEKLAGCLREVSGEFLKHNWNIGFPKPNARHSISQTIAFHSELKQFVKPKGRVKCEFKWINFGASFRQTILRAPRSSTTETRHERAKWSPYHNLMISQRKSMLEKPWWSSEGERRVFSSRIFHKMLFLLSHQLTIRVFGVQGFGRVLSQVPKSLISLIRRQHSLGETENWGCSVWIAPPPD